MNKLKKNFLYNILYQSLLLIIPLIIAPYLSRVIGAKGVGIYSYTYSIVYYFMLLTLLGVNNYGNRSIAKVRDNKKKLSKTFWSIYSLQLIMGIIMILLYTGYILLFNNKYKLYAIIEVLFIVSAILDINWFFFGLEEFKKTIVRNTFVKIGNVILIFFLVKTSNDLWKYILIMSVMTCMSQLLIWSFLKNKINFIKINISDITKHIKPNIFLFIPELAISIYKIMDKIMIGYFNNVKEVGYYENAEKIIGIPLTIIAALGTVMLPRISNILVKGNDDKVKEYIFKSFKYIMFMSLAMCAGLIGIGYNFAPVYFGDEFKKTGVLIMLLSITIPFLSFKHLLTTQFLIPKEKDKIYIKSIILGAITNLVLNFIFIPKFASIGACFGTIAAEFIVMFYQAFAVRKELPISKYITNSIPFLIKSIIMLVVVYSFNFIDMNTVIRLLIQIISGCLIYGLLNIKYILSIVNIKKILKKFKRKKA